MSHRQNNRDRNEAALIELWRAFGCFVSQMDRMKGYDLIVICPRTGTHLVEVKNPERKWTLTKDEARIKAEVESAGGVYNIIETEQQARELVGLYAVQ